MKYHCDICRYSAAFYDTDAWNASATWYNADIAEAERTGDGTPWSATPHFESCGSVNNNSGQKTKECTTVRDIVEASVASLGALLDQFHVDVYAAGHVHSYSTTWPIFGGIVAKKSLIDPHGTVHVVEGNGGVPGTHRASRMKRCTRSAPQEPHSPIGVFRTCGQGMNYGRLITTNASVLTYEHVNNANGHVEETWSIVKTRH